MKTSLITIGLLLLFSYAFSQDNIIKRDASEIKVKVLEVTSTEVKYKKYSNPEGPTYSIPKSEIFMIQYENGTKESFDNEVEQPRTTNKPVVNNSTGNKQELDCNQSNIKGVQYAEQVNSSIAYGAAGLAGGCLLGIIGGAGVMLVAGLSDPQPKTIPQNVNESCFRNGYSKTAKKKHLTSSGLGCTAGVGVLIIVYAMLIAGSGY
ncbi:MAG: hypothetical protein JKY33_07630 [Bacteroidia bacterium]|nr:hypothetical protein [Bacteroidia bacterium]